MAEREWVRPAAALDGSQPQLRRDASAGVVLRPLSLGELLDRTFTLYRSRFWLFATISMVAAAVYTVSQSFALAALEHAARHPVAAPPASTPLQAMMQGIHAAGQSNATNLPVMLLFAIVSAVVYAATATAVTGVYLGRDAEAGKSLLAVMPRWYRWMGITLWQVFSIIWPPLCVAVPATILLLIGVRSGNLALEVIGGVLLALALLAGIPVGIILYLRYALAVPVAVTEGLTFRAAIRRSKVLTAGAKGRAFLVLLVAGALLEVVAVLQLPASYLIMASPAQSHYLARGLSLLVSFVGHTVVTPVALIGLTLLYFDQRVRKEAFDLELLLQNTVTAEVTAVERYAAQP